MANAQSSVAQINGTGRDISSSRKKVPDSKVVRDMVQPTAMLYAVSIEICLVRLLQSPRPAKAARVVSAAIENPIYVLG